MRAFLCTVTISAERSNLLPLLAYALGDTTQFQPSLKCMFTSSCIKTYISLKKIQVNEQKNLRMSTHPQLRFLVKNESGEEIQFRWLWSYMKFHWGQVKCIQWPLSITLHQFFGENVSLSFHSKNWKDFGLWEWRRRQEIELRKDRTSWNTLCSSAYDCHWNKEIIWCIGLDPLHSMVEAPVICDGQI